MEIRKLHHAYALIKDPYQAKDAGKKGQDSSQWFKNETK